ncbi:MAG: DNA polymerase IV, partial [Arcobacteraceae bacterium]|nr:DNA polymerase IV [Arcobacteraceae bacterium]
KEAVIELFTKIDIHPTHNIIQVNITLSNFEETKTMTMNLLEYENDTKQAKLTNSLQKLRDKFGIDIIKSGGEL